MVRSLDRLADYSDASILDELRRVARTLGKDTLTRRDLSHARLSYTLLRERFGGLRKALARAGLSSPSFYRDIPDADLLAELARVWDAVLSREGRNPQKRDLRKYGCRYSHHPYCRRWGTWIRACEALVAWDEAQQSQLGAASAGQPKTEPQPGGPRPKRDIPLGLRWEVFKRDSYRCVVCGRSPATHPGLTLHTDHVVPESRGGATHIDNLRVLCDECNAGRGNSM